MSIENRRGITGQTQKNCINFMGNEHFVGAGRPSVVVEEKPKAKKVSERCLQSCGDLPAHIASIEKPKKKFKAAWEHYSNMSPDDHE